jgi:hypothetical protein
MKILLIIAAIFAAAFAARKKIDATGGAASPHIGGGGFGGVPFGSYHSKRPSQCTGGGGYDQIVLNPSISSGFKLSFNIGTVHNSIPRVCAAQED